MKALRVILGVLGVLIVAYLVLCLVGPKKVDASSSTEIEAPASVIYQQIGNLENWVNWGPWQNADTTMEITYSEKTQGQGASYSWTSENMGSGKLEVVEANAPTSMNTKMKFDNWDGYSYGSWQLDETEDGTTAVTWSMTSDPNPFLLRGMTAIMGMNKKVEEDFSKGLATLKEIAEEQAANMPATYNGYEVNLVEIPATTYAGIREEITMDAMSDFMANAYGQLMPAVMSNGVEMTGPPSNFYYTWDEENRKTDMAAVIPIAESVNLGENIAMLELPAGQAAVIDYYGAYDGLEGPHLAMEAYMQARGIEFAAPAIEMYVTDPEQEPDTTKWLTRVMYRLN